MGLNYGSLIIADARVISLHGVQGLGVFRLRFSIEFTPTTGSEEHKGVVLSAMTAQVHAGATGDSAKYLGTAKPEAPIWLRTGAYSHSHAVLFDLDLSQEQLAALERARGGGSLAFRLQLMAEGSRAAERMPVNKSLQYTSGLEEWSRVLNELGSERLLVFAIPLPRSPEASRYTAAGEALRRAHQDYVRGRYEDVVARTRKIIEEIWAAEDVTPKAAAAAVEKYGTNRRAMSKRERALFVQEAIRHYSHPPHHATGGSEQDWYSSTDAALALALASACLADNLARREAGEEAND
jgi:hypothetical protein